MNPVLRGVIVVVIVAVTAVLVFRILFGGPNPEIGKCVDARNGLVDCSDGAAVFELVREVDSGQDCPSESLKLYAFRSSLYCGVALEGAPESSTDYIPCLLLAGAKLTGDADDLSFATPYADQPASRREGIVTVTGDDWRIYYVLFEGQLDPGPEAVVADPSKVQFAAYIDDATSRRDEVAAALRCAPSA
ncbi:MAG: hypothetical protein ACR2LK_13810 [Solirubrobacteraceae bacterium]